MSDYDRLVERARDRARDGWFHAPDDVRELLDDLADEVEVLRDAVTVHRTTIMSNHCRWGAGPDHPKDGCDDPECTHVPQIVTADAELWHAAGVDKAKWYEHPVARLTRVADKLRDERNKYLARVATLEGGIQEHREKIAVASHLDERLWALLDAGKQTNA